MQPELKRGPGRRLISLKSLLWVFSNLGRGADFFPSCRSRKKKRERRKRERKRRTRTAGKTAAFQEEAGSRSEFQQTLDWKGKVFRAAAAPPDDDTETETLSIFMQCQVKPEGGIADTDVLTEYDGIAGRFKLAVLQVHVYTGNQSISGTWRLRLYRPSTLKSSKNRGVMVAMWFGFFPHSLKNVSQRSEKLLIHTRFPWGHKNRRV